MPDEDEPQSSINDTVGNILGIVIRRRWWILTPFCLITLATIVALLLMPNRYTSAATLLVVQQQVPQRYVVPNSTTDITATLQAMKQEVLARGRLLKMIDDLGLYEKERKRMAPEQLIALMLDNIGIDPINETAQKDFDAFRISYTAENAILAQQVTNTLTSLFISEYLRTGAEQSTNTTGFLHDNVELKRQELDAQEQRLREFKMRYVGELPEQQQGNLGILNGLQTQLQNTVASLNRAQQNRVYLQTMIDGARRQVATSTTSGGSPSAVGGAGPLEAAQAELNRLQTEKASLLAKGYTAQHPDMPKLQREITQAESAVKRLQGAAEARAKEAQAAYAQANSAPATIETREDPALAQLKSSFEVNRMEIEALISDEKRLKATIGQYENRLNQTPVREQQQSGIVRDTEVLRQQYAELLKKEQESQLATNLEKKQGGQQFRLVEPASLPTVPTSPKRLKGSLAGAAAGIVLGLAVALLLEMRNTSYRAEKELTRHLSPPFVLGIPLLPTAAEEKRCKRSSALQWVAASTMVLMVLVAELYVYKHG